MCRQHVLYGWLLVAFGLGILIGMRLESHFFGNLLGIVSILSGVSVLLKK